MRTWKPKGTFDETAKEFVSKFLMTAELTNQKHGTTEKSIDGPRRVDSEMKEQPRHKHHEKPSNRDPNDREYKNSRTMGTANLHTQVSNGS